MGCKPNLRLIFQENVAPVTGVFSYLFIGQVFIPSME